MRYSVLVLFYCVAIFFFAYHLGVTHAPRPDPGPSPEQITKSTAALMWHELREKDWAFQLADYPTFHDCVKAPAGGQACTFGQLFESGTTAQCTVRLTVANIVKPVRCIGEP